jgi:DeoR family L-fucose operon activator
MLLKRAAQSLLLIDKSKFNRSGEARIGHLDDVTHIVRMRRSGKMRRRPEDSASPA